MANAANKSQWVSLKRQRRAINKWLPTFITKIKRGILSISGVIKPRPLSCVYVIQIKYRLGFPPTVFVIDPKLEMHPNWEFIPHRYKDHSLCLYFPDLNEWSPHRLIAKTTIPWMALWLMYYEFWSATGRRGGWGDHPSPIEQPPNFDCAYVINFAVSEAIAGEQLQSVPLPPIRKVA